MLPGVSSYAVTYACVKTVDSSMFFWIVFYMTEGLKFSESSATLLAMAYDAAQVLGSLLSGKASDLLGSRPPVFFVMLLAACFCSLSIVAVSTWEALLPVIFSIGFTTGGPCMLMHTAVAADVGARGHRGATSAIVGIVDGAGSAAAAVGQVIIGYVSQSYGWNAVFMMLTAILAAAVAMAGSIWIMERAEVRRTLFLRVSNKTTGAGSDYRRQQQHRHEANTSLDSSGNAPLLKPSPVEKQV